MSQCDGKLMGDDVPSTEVLKLVLEGDGLGDSHTIYESRQSYRNTEGGGTRTLGDFWTTKRLFDDDVAT